MSFRYAWNDLRTWVKLRLKGRTPGHGEIYAAKIAAKLRRGEAHATLGGRAWDGAQGDLGTEWSSESFAARGVAVFEELQRLGLRRGMRCLDYGCGSLRIGQHVMRLLDPGCYIGLDVTDEFYTYGLANIGPELIAEKRPHLAVLSDAVIDEQAKAPPDFLFSSAVVQHVPPRELGTYFGRILKLTGADTTAVVSFVIADKVQRTAQFSWFYPAERLIRAVRDLDPAIRIDVVPYDITDQDRRGRQRQALVLRR